MQRSLSYATIARSQPSASKCYRLHAYPMNVLSKSDVRLLNLKPEPYPSPIKVAGVDQTSFIVSEKYEVPLQLGAYHESIWCNFLPMDVDDILLGRPRIYDKNATNYGRDNTMYFLPMERGLG